jgi:hypothetical protein
MEIMPLFEKSFVHGADSAGNPDRSQLGRFYSCFRMDYIDPQHYYPTCELGKVALRDTAAVNWMLDSALATGNFPASLRFCWSAVRQADNFPRWPACCS